MNVRLSLVCAAIVMLAGCVPAGTGTGATGGLALMGAQPNANTQGIRTLSVLGGTVKVRGPDGYCVDRRSSRPTEGFAVLAGCARVSSAQIMPAIEGIITVQIGRTGTAIVRSDPEALAGLLPSEAGRTLLSGLNDPRTVAVSDVRTSADGIVEVYFIDNSPPSIRGVQEQQWRAFFDMGGRLVTLGVRGTEHDPLSRDQGAQLLRAAVREFLMVNAPRNSP